MVLGSIEQLACIKGGINYKKIKLEVMNLQGMTLIMIPSEELELLKTSQAEILQQLKDLRTKQPGQLPVNFITAKEFMKAVYIGRTKFDQLVSSSKIKVIKKRRKIYVPIQEIERYFKDPNVK